MKTILFLIDTTGPGGAETVFLDIAEKCKDYGYQPYAMIRGSGWVERELIRRKINYQISDCKGSFNLRFLNNLISTIKREGIVLIHAHLFGSNVYGSLAGIYTRVPVVATFHGTVDIQTSDRHLTLKLLCIRLGAKAIVCVTDRLRSRIERLKLIKKSRVQTIYNGVDIAKYKRLLDRSYREKLRAKDSLLVGSLGNIRAPKNYDLAIRAVYLLHKRGINIHYAIAGQGSESQMAPLKSLIAQLKLTKHVHLLGFTENVQEFLSNLDIFLMSSSTEGHPLALTQAMIAGLTIVSTPSGVEEIIEHNKTGFIAEKHEPESLASQIEKAFFSKQQSDSISIASTEFATTNFSMLAMMMKYSTLYKKLI